MKESSNFEENKPEKKEDNIEVRHIEKEKLEEIMKEYEEDPDIFYQKNEFILWDEGKNPALILSAELMSKFIREVWEEKGNEKWAKTVRDAKNVAMVVMKYLGADIEGWCKVDPETAISVNEKMGEDDSFKENCQFILENVKKNDPIFSEFLTKICVNDIDTKEKRNKEDMVAIIEMVALITRTMYEQMQKDAKIN